MKGYPQYLWFVVLALLLVCTGCSNEGETEDDNNQHVKVEGFASQSKMEEEDGLVLILLDLAKRAESVDKAVCAKLG